MTRPFVLFAAGAAVLALSGCSDYYDGGYGQRVSSVGYSDAPYYDTGYYGQSSWYGRPYAFSWYDGYYGQVSSGYWASDGNYYYRSGNRGQWQRSEGNHFYRGERAPNDRWRETRDWHRDGNRDRDDRRHDRRRY